MIKNTLYKLFLRIKGVQCHHTALVKTLDIGKKTRVWAFTNISKNVKIGDNCNICDRCFIEESVIIGDNVTIKTGVSLWKGIKIESNVFIGPGVQFCNDKFPRSKLFVKPVQTVLRQGCSIGAGAVILPGLIIHENAMIGAGSVVTRDVGKNHVVAGNPARVIKHQ